MKPYRENIWMSLLDWQLPYDSQYQGNSIYFLYNID